MDKATSKAIYCSHLVLRSIKAIKKQIDLIYTQLKALEPNSSKQQPYQSNLNLSAASRSALDVGITNKQTNLNKYLLETCDARPMICKISVHFVIRDLLVPA